MPFVNSINPLPNYWDGTYPMFEQPHSSPLPSSPYSPPWFQYFVP
ncbi:hypothetical protein [Sulfurisphaera ohwakuensis]|uniref:Uncharacterized protein n=1 Tax=Sulfurisphaera ohwakuensis TaxID=69656 RepID=A0A7J9RVL5_SULOH|nr:hypothetical protein [Sulfurisphaera ohwakuensis]MBB5254861.1 hypothetical protein [Sulfurisphaera ohwakuensis]